METLKSRIIELVAKKGLDAQGLLDATKAERPEVQKVVNQLVNKDKTHTLTSGVLAPRTEEAAPAQTTTTTRKRDRSKRRSARVQAPQAEAQEQPAPVPTSEARAEAKPAMKAINELSEVELRERIAACADELAGDVVPLVAESLDRIIKKYRKQLGKR